MMQQIGDGLANFWRLFGIPGVLILLALVLIGVACTDQLINAWHERRSGLTDEEREKLAPLRFHKDVALQLTKLGQHEPL